MKLIIEKGDITTYSTDTIVNAANTSLLAGSGVCGAIFRAAGYAKLQAECDKLSPIKTGEAVITNGYNLKAKYVIHTAGPIYSGPESGKYLKAAYYNSLKLADDKGLASIAFPSISTGIYGYPLEDAARIAVDTILSFSGNNLTEVYMVCFNYHTKDVYEKALKELE